MEVAFKEIARAAAGLARQVAAGTLRPEDVTRERLEQALTAGTRPVDLLVRTAGDQRLSDFLLWECAYAELYYTDALWPDFSGADLTTAVSAYRGRERRFGGLLASTA